MCNLYTVKPKEPPQLPAQQRPEGFPCLNPTNMHGGFVLGFYLSAVPRQFLLEIEFSYSCVCPADFWRPCLKVFHIHNTQFILIGNRTVRETYIFITLLLLQVAVCETSSAFSIRNKLAERSQRIYFQQVLRKCEHINSISSMWLPNAQCIKIVCEKRLNSYLFNEPNYASLMQWTLGIDKGNISTRSE